MYYSEFRTSELCSSELRGFTSEFRKWFSEYTHSEFRHSELRHSEFRGYTIHKYSKYIQLLFICFFDLKIFNLDPYFV